MNNIRPQILRFLDTKNKAYEGVLRKSTESAYREKNELDKNIESFSSALTKVKGELLSLTHEPRKSSPDMRFALLIAECKKQSSAIKTQNDKLASVVSKLKVLASARVTNQAATKNNAAVAFQQLCRTNIARNNRAEEELGELGSLKISLASSSKNVWIADKPLEIAVQSKTPGGIEVSRSLPLARIQKFDGNLPKLSDSASSAASFFSESRAPKYIAALPEPVKPLLVPVEPSGGPSTSGGFSTSAGPKDESNDEQQNSQATQAVSAEMDRTETCAIDSLTRLHEDGLSVLYHGGTAGAVECEISGKSALTIQLTAESEDTQQRISKGASELSRELQNEGFEVDHLQIEKN